MIIAVLIYYNQFQDHLLPSGPVPRSTLLSTPFSWLGPASFAPKALLSGYKPTGLGIAAKISSTKIHHYRLHFLQSFFAIGDEMQNCISLVFLYALSLELIAIKA